MDLDDLLARSAPAVTPRTPALDDVLTELARETESRHRAAGRLRRAAGAGVAAAALGLGVAGTAVAVNNGALWFTTTGSGDMCEMEFAVHPVGISEELSSGEPATIMEGRTAWPSQEEQDAVATEARSYLGSYDFDAIDREAAMAEYDVEQRRIIAEAAPGEKQPLDVGDDLEVRAVQTKVARDLVAHLEGLGMDPHVVTFAVGMSAGCAE